MSKTNWQDTLTRSGVKALNAYASHHAISFDDALKAVEYRAAMRQVFSGSLRASDHIDKFEVKTGPKGKAVNILAQALSFLPGGSFISAAGGAATEISKYYNEKNLKALSPLRKLIGDEDKDIANFTKALGESLVQAQLTEFHKLGPNTDLTKLAQKDATLMLEQISEGKFNDLITKITENTRVQNELSDHTTDEDTKNLKESITSPLVKKMTERFAKEKNINLDKEHHLRDARLETKQSINTNSSKSDQESYNRMSERFTQKNNGVFNR